MKTIICGVGYKIDGGNNQHSKTTGKIEATNNMAHYKIL